MKRRTLAMLAALLVVSAFGGVARAGSPDRQELSAWPDATLAPEEPWWRSGDERPYWRKNLFKRIGGDQKYLFTTWLPAESHHLGFTIPLGVSLVAASSSSGSLDSRWQASIEDWTGDGGRHDVASGLTRLGDAESALVLVGGTYLVSRWAGNERMQRTSSLSAEALINSAIYSTLLKRLAHRTRPADGGTGEFFVSDPEGGQSAASFPSGHAMGAFAVAAVFSREFEDKPWVPWVARGTATLIGLSRVGLGRHFPSDVLAGAVLGNSLGTMVSERSGGAEDRKPAHGLEPLFEPRNGGVGLGYHHTW